MNSARIEFAKIFASLKKWRIGVPDSAVEKIAADFSRSPWAILVATIISLRTKDEVTLRCADSLLRQSPSPEAYRKLSEKDAEDLIYPAGFYRVKARQIRAVAEILISQYQGKVPADLDKLLALPGVGLKTANLVLATAFAQDAICVDIHVHRIANRLGWVATAKPEQTEAALKQILPRRYWQIVNADFVLYGQRICRPLSPYCSRCVIRENCARVKVEKFR